MIVSRAAPFYGRGYALWRLWWWQQLWSWDAHENDSTQSGLSVCTLHFVIQFGLIQLKSLLKRKLDNENQMSMQTKSILSTLYILPQPCYTLNLIYIPFTSFDFPLFSLSMDSESDGNEESRPPSQEAPSPLPKLNAANLKVRLALHCDETSDWFILGLYLKSI